MVSRAVRFGKVHEEVKLNNNLQDSQNQDDEHDHPKGHHMGQTESERSKCQNQRKQETDKIFHWNVWCFVPVHGWLTHDTTPVK